MANRLTYQIGFTADTSQLQQAIQDAHRSLQALSTFRTGGLNITSDLKEAAIAAQELQHHLLTAVDVNTGRLDLSKFQASLTASNRTLTDYANRLQAIGPQGEQAFLQVASAIAKAEMPLARSSKLLDSLWLTMRNTMRWQLTSSMLHGFIGSVQTAVGYTQDLNESLNNIRIVTKASAEDMRDFSQQANDAAARLSTTTTDYTDASLIYYQQGLNDEEVAARTETTIKMANVSRESAETVSEWMTAIWNNFDDGSKSLDYYADVMTKLGAATASSSAEIAEGVQQFAAAGSTVGLSYEYAASALATITSETRQSANVVGTALRTLFTRIQGLSLGETLEDGTDLNKYSNALATIGVNIKDQNGELKDMDTILNEMGEKWNTISKDQQVALAQTVGGVRQYTQLIALMSNWDVFQENLEMAYESTGELNKQANIFADSWEAARNEVRAAAEDVYDSLINEDFFIEFDKDLANVLHGIATSVDALGGMEGAINLVGLAFTTAFGNRIAQSIRDLTYNFTVLTGKADEAQRRLKESAGQAALTMATNSARSTAQGVSTATIQAEDIEMQNMLSMHARRMTEEQQKQLLGYKDIITAIKTIALEQSELVATRRQETDALEQTVLQQQNLVQTSQQYGQVLNLRVKPLLQGLTIPNFSNVIRQNINSVNTMVTAYKNLNTTAGRLSQIRVQLNGLDESTASNVALINQLRTEFTSLTGYNFTGSNLQTSLTETEAVVHRVETALQRMYDVLIANGADPAILGTFGETAASIGEHMQASGHATRLSAEETKNYMLAVYNATLKSKDWASTIVSTSQHLMSLGMMMQSIRTIVSTINDEDMSFGDKLITVLTSIGMIAPQAITLLKAFNATRVEYAAVTVAGTAATEADILAQAAATGATTAHTTAKVMETKVVDGNTVAVIANTTAWYANPIFWIVAAVTAAVAAFAIYTSAVEENTKKQIENAKATADASREQVKKNQEERASINELYSEYIELRSQLGDSAEAKDTLRQHTEELCKALGIEWSELDKLSDKYDEVNRKIAETNRQAILDEISDLNEDIDNQSNAIKYQWKQDAWANETNYDYALLPSTGATDLDEYDFNKAFIEFMTERFPNAVEDSLGNYSQDGLKFFAGTGFPDLGAIELAFNEENYTEVMSALGDFINYVRDPDNGINYSGSENWNNLLSQYTEVLEHDENINDAQKQRLELMQDLAEAQAAINGLDLAGVKTLDEYETYKDAYINELKGLYNTYDLLTPEMDNAYFEDLAEEYLSGYANLEDKIISSNVLDEIVAKVGEHNRDIITGFIGDEAYDVNALALINWDIIDEDGEDLATRIEEEYQIAKDKVDAEVFKLTLPSVVDISNTLRNEGEAGLEEDQIKILQTLEKEYVELGQIRDRSSAQYIQALRDIREGMESTVTRDSLNNLKDAYEELVNIAHTKTKPSADEDWQIVDFEANLNNEKFRDQLDAIMDADYAITVAIEADLQSDINDITDYVVAIEEATGMIQEGFKVSYKDVEALQAVFPGILAGYTTTADGMIQLNSDIAESAIGLARTQVEAEIEAAKANIQSYANVQLAKAAAMRTIAENLKGLATGEIQGEEGVAKAKENINNAMLDFKDAVADEEALISEGLATSEIDDSNQVMEANENAAGTSANNWAGAYDSMAKNSKEWAEIAIRNANAVGQAIAAAAEGGDASKYLTDVASGAIQSTYSGDASKYEYANTYESRGADDLSWEDYYEAGDYQAAYEDAIKQAESYEAAAAEALGWMAKLDGANAAVDNYVNTAGKDTSGGDKEGKKYDQEDEKTLKDIEDRYHEINREIAQQDELLDDINDNIDRTYGANKLDAYDKKIKELNEQQANYNAKLAEAQGYLTGDKARLDSLFNNTLSYDANGEINNYNAALQWVIDQYNQNFLLGYNEFLAEYSLLTKAEQELRQAEYDSWQTKKEAAEAQYDARFAALKTYEGTLDTINEIKNSIQDTARQIEDEKLNKIEHRLEVVIDMKEMKDNVRDLTKEIAESFGDALTHGTEVAILDYQSALANMGLLSEYKQTFNDYKDALASATDATDIDRIIGDLKDLQGQAIGTAEALLEWTESIETMLPEAIDAASERFSLFTNQLEHNESILGTIKELYVLQGASYKTMQGFGDLNRVAQEKMDAQLAQAELQKAWFEGARRELLEAEAALEGVAETDAAYDTLKNNRDALLEEYNEAQAAMLEAAQAAMETAQEIYTSAIERTVYLFDQAVSGGQGLDFLQEKYDHFIDTEERYLDKVNEAYEIDSWHRKLQADIDEATNKSHIDSLKWLQQEIDLRAEGGKLSKYDLDILEAKYNLLQAQMALEDAQNAKNNLRLVRDEQGNWNYQYTADQGEIANAEQQVADAQNEWYNIAKDQSTETAGEIISTWQECAEKIQEVYQDMTLTEEERAIRVEEIREFYNQKIIDLEEAHNTALRDMVEAGSDEIVNIWQDNSDQITSILSGEAESIKAFDENFADLLSDMTIDSGAFGKHLNELIASANKDFINFGTSVDGIAKTTGTSMNELSGYVDKVSTSTDTCREAGLEAAEALWAELNATRSLSEGYSGLAGSVYEYINALKVLAIQMALTAGKETTKDLGGDGAGGNNGDGAGEDKPPKSPETIPDIVTTASSISHSDMVQLVYDMGKGNYKNNPYRKDIVEGKYPGLYSAAQNILNNAMAEDKYNYNHNGTAWKQTIDKIASEYGFATGGYTGEFDGGKLAFLHEKELVLNQEDTENIMAAVSTVRLIGPELFASIEKALDGNATAALALMASKLSGANTIGSTHDTIEQHVTIERVEFPNVTSSDEIQDAFASIVNDASQWARRRKS